jgi:predicted porin
MSVFAQDDLLDELETDATPQSFVSPAFKAMRIMNVQSTKVAAKGDFYLYVSHRFGSLEEGLTTFFGLDNANTRIQLVYGLFEGWQFGISRESLRETYAASTKVKLKSQTENFPVSLVGYGTLNINTQVRKDRFPFLTFDDRLSYTTQLLISRRFSNSFSLELAPSYVRHNLTLEANQKHDQFAMGVGGRLKISKRMSINMDYAYNFSRADNTVFKDPLTIGVDIETGGHVFQLLFSNAQSTNEPGFLSYAEGDWGDGDIFFGFNIVRVF